MTTRIAYLVVAAMALAGCPDSDGAPAKDAPKVPPTKNGPREVAIFAGGCFWGMEEWMKKAPGIVETDVGYIGGKTAKASYEQVSAGITGHAEAVRVVFDPTVISYDELLSKWFFRLHDPTTKDRQGNDAGPQYRSAIFPTSDAQRRTAELVKTKVEKSGKWERPITTTIESSTTWVTAEDYHQDYLVKHPGGYDNHYMRDFKF